MLQLLRTVFFVSMSDTLLSFDVIKRDAILSNSLPWSYCFFIAAIFMKRSSKNTLGLFNLVPGSGKWHKIYSTDGTDVFSVIIAHVLRLQDVNSIGITTTVTITTIHAHFLFNCFEFINPRYTSSEGHNSASCL